MSFIKSLPITSDMVSLWVPSGTSAIDLIRENHGQVSGAHPNVLVNTGLIDPSLGWYFDGSDDYVRKASMASPGIPLSISMWVNSPVSNPVGLFDSAPVTQHVLRNIDAGYVEWWDDNPQLAFDVDADTWTHLVFIYKFVGGNRTIEWYKNSVYQASATGDATTNMAWNDFTLGTINTTSSPYTGYIALPFVTNSVWSQAQVSNFYLATKGMFAPRG